VLSSFPDDRSSIPVDSNERDGGGGGGGGGGGLSAADAVGNGRGDNRSWTTGKNDFISYIKVPGVVECTFCWGFLPAPPSRRMKKKIFKNTE